MVRSKSQAIREFTREVLRTHSVGVTKEEMVEVLEREVNVAGTDGGELITLEEASRRFSIPRGTLGKWLFRGHLKERGRLPFPARGHGKVLVYAEDVAWLKEHPRREGRPPKERPK